MHGAMVIKKRYDITFAILVRP